MVELSSSFCVKCALTPLPSIALVQQTKQSAQLVEALKFNTISKASRLGRHIKVTALHIFDAGATPYPRVGDCWPS